MSQVHSITHLPVHSTVFGSVIWFFTVRLVSMMPLKETRKRTMELPLATVRVQRAAARTRFRVSVNLLAVPGRWRAITAPAISAINKRSPERTMLDSP